MLRQSLLSGQTFTSTDAQRSVLVADRDSPPTRSHVACGGRTRVTSDALTDPTATSRLVDPTVAIVIDLISATLESVGRNLIVGVVTITPRRARLGKTLHPVPILVDASLRGARSGSIHLGISLTRSGNTALITTHIAGRAIRL
jgi:hypothetical protein